jgi:hypothetical protein
MRSALIGLVLAMTAWASTPVPLYFEPNRGQVNAGIRYVAPIRNAVVFLTDRDINDAATLEFEGSDTSSAWSPAAPAAGPTSYIKGREPSKWLRDIPHFARMERKGIYPGIDLVLYGAEGRLEYDFLVAPGADPGHIRIRFGGARGQLFNRSRDGNRFSQ